LLRAELYLHPRRDYVPTVGYKICNKSSGKCLDAGTSKTAGSAIAQRTYNASAGQIFNVVKLTPGVYKIVNKASGLALDGSGAINNTQWGGTANVIQGAYTGTATQKWNIASMGGSDPGMNRLVPGNWTNWTLGVADSTDGTKSTTGNWLSNDYQKWVVSPI